MLEVLSALAPSAGVGLLFWFAIRAMLQADRRERAAMAKLERDAAPEMGKDSDSPV